MESSYNPELRTGVLRSINKCTDSRWCEPVLTGKLWASKAGGEGWRGGSAIKALAAMAEELRTHSYEMPSDL